MEENQVKPLILYGAGGNSKTVFQRFVAEGRTPVCFCDGDPVKIGSVWDSGDGFMLDILSLDDALCRYNNAEFYVTPEAPIKYEIIDKLKENEIPRNNIINHEAYVKRVGCYELESWLQFERFECISFCCSGTGRSGVIPKVPMLDLSNKDLHMKCEAIRQQAMYDLENSIATGYCYSCPKAVSSYWPEERKIEWIIFGAGGSCQFNCSYCGGISSSPVAERKRSVERALSYIKYIRDQKIVDYSTLVQVITGEITINPMKEEIIKTFHDHPCIFFTNGEYYSDEIEMVLKKVKSRINCSLDAGTTDTFKLIKGRDCFSKVCNNLKQYAKHGPIDLKYILIPGLNDGRKDIVGFFELASEIDARVVLTRDVKGYDNFIHNIDETLETIKFFVKNAKIRDLALTNEGFIFDGLYKDRLIEAYNSY